MFSALAWFYDHVYNFHVFNIIPSLRFSICVSQKDRAPFGHFPYIWHWFCVARPGAKKADWPMDSNMSVCHIQTTSLNLSSTVNSSKDYKF